jgi:predicted kinase
MEAVIFCGPQASGKSSFYKEHFFATHVRINLDMLRTRRRESLLLEACLAGGQRFVADNTNPCREDRARYMERAKAAHFSATGYFFAESPPDCLKRNASRSGRARIPEKGVGATFARLEPPAWDEGFDRLFTVRIGPGGVFLIVEQTR